MLSKTDLQSYLQCPRKLWLERHRPALAPTDDSTVYRRAVDGNIVGEKAREQLGHDVIWPPSSPDHLETIAEAGPMSPKGPELTAKEYRALRDISLHLIVEQPLLYHRLKALGLIEQKLGGWVLTQSGHILLMFSAAR